jgi:hypothetical protein
MCVEALLRDPGRSGWRGNRAEWVRRARRVLSATVSPAEAGALAAAIDDASLLTPGLACLVPLHPRHAGRFSALWQDAQHRALTRPRSAEGVRAWLAALVYVVRHHPRLGFKRARDLRVACPPGALALALDDAAWEHGTAASADRTRTVMVLIAVDAAADAPTLRRALRWLATERPPGHRTAALSALVYERLRTDPVDGRPEPAPQTTAADHLASSA